MTKSNFFFILGAPDPEMREIEELLQEKGLSYAYAANGNRRVHSANAYDAPTYMGRRPAGSRVVFVECSIRGLEPDFVIDHHKEGDPGFSLGPEQYWEGSSLGQFCNLMQIEPNERLRVIAAADHCLTAAYQGLCPNVDPDDLAYWRLSSRAAVQNRKLSELQARINEAEQYLLDAPRQFIDGVAVADLGYREGLEEVSEASARLGIPFVYIENDREGRFKKGIKGAPKHVIEQWLSSCELPHKYGCPERGYAGAYSHEVSAMFD